MNVVAALSSLRAAAHDCFPASGVEPLTQSAPTLFHPEHPRGDLPAQRILYDSPHDLVQYLAASVVCRGYWFYVAGIVPAGKDPAAVDAKLVEKYAANLPNSTRWRRKKARRANVRYLRHGRRFFLFATKGDHPLFAEEAGGVRDFRRHPLRVGGYSVSFRRDGRDQSRRRVHVPHRRRAVPRPAGEPGTPRHPPVRRRPGGPALRDPLPRLRPGPRPVVPPPAGRQRPPQAGGPVAAAEGLPVLPPSPAAEADRGGLTAVPIPLSQITHLTAARPGGQSASAAGDPPARGSHRKQPSPRAEKHKGHRQNGRASKHKTGEERLGGRNG